MLYVAWKKRGLPGKFALFVLFCPIKKRSLYPLVCFGSIFMSIGLRRFWVMCDMTSLYPAFAISVLMTSLYPACG